MPRSTIEDAGAVPSFIGLGANLGDARATLVAALNALAELPETSLRVASSIYRSAPMDSSGPDYLNAVAWLETHLSPQALLAELQRIERDHGRERPYRNAPRTLDLDLLLYGAQSVAEPALTVPHPRMHLRAFVIAPLLEIAPDCRIPGRGSAAAWLPAVSGQAIEKLAP